jgi:cofilin
MATGVSVSDSAITDFETFKKASNSTKFLIYTIENKTTIVTETSSESASFEEFLSLLPPNDCRYAVYKMDFTTNDGRPGTKLASISWYLKKI